MGTIDGYLAKIFVVVALDRNGRVHEQSHTIIRQIAGANDHNDPEKEAGLSHCEWKSYYSSSHYGVNEVERRLCDATLTVECDQFLDVASSRCRGLALFCLTDLLLVFFCEFLEFQKKTAEKDLLV